MTGAALNVARKSHPAAGANRVIGGVEAAALVANFGCWTHLSLVVFGGGRVKHAEPLWVPVGLRVNKPDPRGLSKRSRSPLLSGRLSRKRPYGLTDPNTKTFRETKPD